MHAFFIVALASMVAPREAAPLAATTTSTYNAATIPAAASEMVETDPATRTTRKRDAFHDKRDAFGSVAADPAALPILMARDGSCVSQPAGAGRTTSPDTPDAFIMNPALVAAATNAPTPFGYNNIFQNVQGSVSGAYLPSKSLTAYNTMFCQEFCDQVGGCMGFNIYFERDPSLDPGTGCHNPPSTNNIRCTPFGAPFTTKDANNMGQWRGPEDSNGQAFDIVITGSNGYVNNTPPPLTTNFTGPVEFGGAINAPSGYIGAIIVSQPGWSFNPDTCAALCQAQTAYDEAHPNPHGTHDSCNFFNMYILSENGVPQGLTCSMYDVSWGKIYSTNYGQYRGSDYYGVSDSYGYTLTVEN